MDVLHDHWRSEWSPGPVNNGIGRGQIQNSEFLRVTKIYTQNLSVINSGAQWWVVLERINHMILYWWVFWWWIKSTRFFFLNSNYILINKTCTCTHDAYMYIDKIIIPYFPITQFISKILYFKINIKMF